MKKSFSAFLVILLTFLGANDLAARMDVQVEKTVPETTDKGGNENQGGRACSSTPGK